MKKVLTILCAIALLGSLQAQTADDIIDQYFENIGGRAAWSEMDYLTFIKKGYPISSAMAESTCGHLVKERMEQSSMRWSSNGAQKVMDVRAVNLNGDMEDFMRFVIGSERKIGLRKMAA